LQRGKVREVMVESPQIHLTDQFLAMLPKPDSKSDSAPAWSCDRLSIQNGKAKIDLAEWPLAEFDFAAQAEHLTGEGAGAAQLLPGQGADAGAPPLRGPPAGWHGEAHQRFGGADLRVSGPAGGLARGAIQEIAIDDPVVHVTDRLLAWRPASKGPAEPPAAAG